MDPVNIIEGRHTWISMQVGSGRDLPDGSPTMKIQLWEPGGSLHSEIGTATQLERAGVAQLRDVCDLWLRENDDES